MGIPAQRFGDLRAEFNIPMGSIAQTDPSQILNSASNSTLSFTADILNAVSSLTQALNLNSIINQAVRSKNSLESALGITKALGAVAGVESAIRQVRGMMQSTINTDSLVGKNIDQIMSGIFKTDPVVRGLMTVMNANLGNSLVANTTVFNPYPPMVVLPSGAPPPPGSSIAVSVSDPTYDCGSIVKVMNGVVGGNSNSTTAYPQTAIDNNALLRQTVMIANLGYAAGLTNVMGTLKNTPGMSGDVFARATAIVMTEQSTKGNAAAIIDMTTGIGSVLTGGNNPQASSPSIITDTLANYTSPAGSTENNASNLADQLLGMSASLDPDWDVSDVDGIPSTKYLQSASSDLIDVLKAKAANNTFDPVTGLTTTFASTEECVLAAMIANDNSVTLFVQEVSRYTDCCRDIVNC